MKTSVSRGCSRDAHPANHKPRSRAGCEAASRLAKPRSSLRRRHALLGYFEGGAAVLDPHALGTFFFDLPAGFALDDDRAGSARIVVVPTVVAELGNDRVVDEHVDLVRVGRAPLEHGLA